MQAKGYKVILIAILGVLLFAGCKTIERVEYVDRWHENKVIERVNDSIFIQQTDTLREYQVGDTIFIEKIKNVVKYKDKIVLKSDTIVKVEKQIEVEKVVEVQKVSFWEKLKLLLVGAGLGAIFYFVVRLIMKFAYNSM